jgi:hypothetical protein
MYWQNNNCTAGDGCRFAHHNGGKQNATPAEIKAKEKAKAKGKATAKTKAKAKGAAVALIAPFKPPEAYSGGSVFQ